MSTLTLLAADNLRAAGIPHGFTTRIGGISHPPFAFLNLGRGVGDDPVAVASNRTAVLRVLGLETRHAIEAQQVHGTALAIVDAADHGRIIAGVDGLITADPTVVLSVHTADCVPVLFAAPARGIVGVVHAGWRGIAAGVVDEAVRVIGKEFTCPRDEVLVALGPSIGPCCYEVDAPVIDHLRRLAWWQAVVSPNARGRWQLDLRAAIRSALVESGLHLDHIETLALCTKCRSDLFFSYRREGTTGRMAALIALPAASV